MIKKIFAFKNIAALLAVVMLIATVLAVNFGRKQNQSVPQEKEHDSLLVEGDGSFTSPFLIRTVEDLLIFRDDVNGGNSYKDRYVKQVADLDLIGVINFTPIGVYGTGKYFEGTYFGGGHTLSNFTTYGIHEDSANNALFGLLLGKVYSIGIESGDVEGGCVASIASHTGGEGALIANCYSKARVHGAREGGIADNFMGGDVFNCFSLSYNLKNEYLPVVSFAANSIVDCYGAGDLAGEDATVQEEITTGKGNALSLIESDNFCDTLNANKNRIYLFRSFIDGMTDFYTQDKNTFFLSDSTERYPLFPDGRGTKYYPYKLNNECDFIRFANLVNEGYDCKNTYFEQTADFNLQGVDFLPIGIFDEGNYFYGTYDGGGYDIKNMTITTYLGGENNAMFGRLGGTVMNANLVGGYIEGNCCASFASHSCMDNAKIVNCTSSVYINGKRSGGIAENFVGYIIGCTYFSKEESLPVVSTDATSVKYSFNNYREIVTENFKGENKGNATVNIFQYEDECFAQKVNGNLAKVSSEAGVALSSLTSYGTQRKVNLFEIIFTHPLSVLTAYFYYFVAFFGVVLSAVYIVVTLKKQRRREKNEK